MSKQLTFSAALAVIATATLALATTLGGSASASQERVAVESPLIGYNVSR